MAYRFEDEEEVREAFWREFPHFEAVGNGRQNEQPADTRMAFCDWIDSLARDGLISEDLAQDVTL